jgi:hypothetical protein
MKADQLKGYFVFDEMDLMANRNLKLSEKQTRKRKDVDQFAERFVLWLFLFLLVLTLVIGFFAVRSITNIALWIWTVIFLLLTLWTFRGVTTKVDDSVQRVRGKVEFVRVEKLSGMPTDSMSERRLETFYEMHVGSETFRNVNPALIEYMEGCEFSVYYTKTTKQILSVEEV